MDKSRIFHFCEQRLDLLNNFQLRGLPRIYWKIDKLNAVSGAGFALDEIGGAVAFATQIDECRVSLTFGFGENGAALIAKLYHLRDGD